MKPPDYQRLCRALLESAVADLTGRRLGQVHFFGIGWALEHRRTSRRRIDKHRAREARSWVLGRTNAIEGFAFADVCDALNLSVARTRAALLAHIVAVHDGGRACAA